LSKHHQIISLNLSDNDLGADFFSTLGFDALSQLKDLSVANSKLTPKSLGDLSDFFAHHKMHFLHLNLSGNHFSSDSFFRFFNSLKNNQVLRRLNLSRNNLGLSSDDFIGACGP
jgi:Ran GTPase-activating protein (RanGAP) involved in mRNA processing and transport